MYELTPTFQTNHTINVPPIINQYILDVEVTIDIEDRKFLKLSLLSNKKISELYGKKIEDIIYEGRL